MAKTKPKIAFYVYPTAFQNPGGGEVQLLKTKEYLEKEGYPVTLFDTWTHKLKNFDILHTFGSVKDALPMMQAAKFAGIKNVLSTICWYSWQSAVGTHGSLKEKTLAITRHAAKSLLPFLPSERKQMMELSDALLPNSESEAAQLRRFFNVSDKKIKIIPNGVDAYFANATPDAFVEKYKLNDFVLCVGRIEPRKNQLNMIKALNSAGVPAVFIGEAVSKYKDYEAACKQAAAKNIHFIGALPRESGLLTSAFAACNTFLLASWLETPGLAALEAGLAGAKVVITSQGATKEYFGNYANYTEPGDITNIREVTLRTFNLPKNDDLKRHIQNHYLWSNTAKKTIEVYEQLGTHDPKS